jgi:hypothetical protein
MEVGDVITHVNSAVVKSIAEIHKKLDDSEGLVQLSVVNVRNGDSQDWQVHPFKVTVSADRSSAVIAPHNRPMLFAYLIADTNDPRIGKGVGISLAQMKQQLSSRITSNQLHLTVISGDDCTASNVIKELALIPSSNLDSIFVYYMGHGAFDPRYGNEDTSNGHFIDLKKKDVLRRTIWQYLHAAPAKLRVVVSDACNVEGEADPFKYRLEQRTRMMTVKGATGLEWLLLGHRGELDLSAAAPNQFAWYSNVSGGFFSQQWIRLGKTNESKWQPFLNSLSTAANAYYQGERTKILATPGDISSTTLNQLRDQVSMDPTTFRISLQRDINSPVDPELTRTMSDSQIVRRLIQP